MRNPENLTLMHRIEQLERCLRTAERILKIDLENGQPIGENPTPNPAPASKSAPSKTG